MSDLWYEECPCDGGVITLGGVTIVCPGCEHSPCAGFRPHIHEDTELVEDEIDTSDLYVA